MTNLKIVTKKPLLPNIDGYEIEYRLLSMEDM